jgi:hypothetical protein
MQEFGLTCHILMIISVFIIWIDLWLMIVICIWIQHQILDQK